MASHTIVLRRHLGKKTTSTVIKKQIDFIVKRAIGGARGKNWRIKVLRASPPRSESGKWTYTRKVSFERTSGRKGTEKKQWEAILDYLVRACNNSKFQKVPWEAFTRQGNPIASQPKSDPTEGKDIQIKSYGSICLEKENYFDHIYQREPHIEIITSALEAARESNLVNRFNCVLWGPPGCGKSEILTSVGKMLGIENRDFLKFDATSATDAGVRDILLKSINIPPVLIVEEIEKTDERSLRWLLGVLDHRAEIRKTNFRIGHLAKNVKMICLATVNDMNLFKKAMSGALASRFPNKIYCPRPDRKLMEEILKRELAKVGGKQKWIKPALEFCMDELKETDPRAIVPVCLCGRDKLLTGEYQKAIRATMKPKEKD